ncbi:MAG: FAD-dependent oxidoreductase, partial [Acidobacteria bacterium]|nr:FAD-dependent oxidoreductase [Acidobacteriota bacterium]NIO58225.1 FAD-dependent oxidoreductase [Acidobacteriota bacterium]NIQ83829.1 FAD-dependent oxidoreductase [Acidobacteriota bacterium]
MAHSRSIVVVGGGVFGISAAIELRARGWVVTVCDPGPLPHPDASSTDISKAVRMDYGADVLYTEMAEASIEGWCRWNAEWDEQLYHPDGFLIMTRAPMKPGSFEHDGFELLRGRGHPVERIDRAGLAARFPAWR